MNPILEKIETADKKLVQFKKLAKQVFDEANADGLIDADEKKEIALVAGQIKAVQDVIQRLKDEFARNMAEWNGHSNDHANLQDQITKLREWGHPEVAPIEAAAGDINDAVLEQYWKEATAQLLACMDEIKPLYDDYLLEYAAREKFLPEWEAFGPRYDAATETTFQTPTLNPAISELALYYGNAERAAEELKYVAALEELANGQKALATVESEIEKLTAQKTETDSLYAELKPRIVATQVSIFEAVAEKAKEIGLAVEKIDESIQYCEFETATDLLTSLVMSLTSYETALAKIASAKDIYKSRIADLQSDLLDVSSCYFESLLTISETIANIQTKMETLAANEDFDGALIEMDLLAIEIEKFKPMLANMQLKEEFDLLLADVEPLVLATAVSLYTPVDLLAEQIDKDYQKAKSAALEQAFAKGITLLEGLPAQLDAYNVLLAEIEVAKTQYTARAPEVIKRFDAQASSEYPGMADMQKRSIIVRDDMERAAEKGDFPAALAALDILQSLMEDLEGSLQANDDRRMDYQARIAGVLARVDAQNVIDFDELVEPRAKMVANRVEMENYARQNNFLLALDTMFLVEEALDSIEARMDELIRMKNEFEKALLGIEAGLKLVEGCSHVELAVKKAEIIKLRDAMQTAVNQTKFDVALEKVKALVTLVEAFETLEVQLKDYTRRFGKAEPRVEAVKAIEYKSFKDQKEAVDTLFGKMVAAANKAELTEALEKMETLEDLLDDVEDALKTMQTDEIRYNDRLSIMQPDIDAAEKNESEYAEKAKKAVLKAYEDMTDEADAHEYSKALEEAENVANVIKAFKAVLDAIGDKAEKYEALKIAIFERLKNAKKHAEEIEKLSDDYDDLEELKEEAETYAGKDEHKEALESLDNLDTGLTEFEAGWLALHDEKLSFEAESAKIIKKYESYTEEEKEKAETEYNAATGYYEKMNTAAESENFEDAVDWLDELHNALVKVDSALLSESEIKQKCEGMYKVLGSTMSKALASPYAKPLDTELKAAQEATNVGLVYMDRENYQGAIDEVPNIEKAFEAFNAKEDKMEQEDAGLKVRYLERVSGFEKRYLKACKPDNEVKSDDLKDRISALPGKWQAMLQAAKESPVDYKIMLKIAEELRDEVDSILDELEA